MCHTTMTMTVSFMVSGYSTLVQLVAQIGAVPSSYSPHFQLRIKMFEDTRQVILNWVALQKSVSRPLTRNQQKCKHKYVSKKAQGRLGASGEKLVSLPRSLVCGKCLHAKLDWTRWKEQSDVQSVLSQEDLHLI